MVIGPTNEESTQLLRDAYLGRGIFLVLGAGVSFASGLPAWPELVHRLFSSCYSPPNPTLFDKLTRESMPLPVLASLLEESARNQGGTLASRETFTPAPGPVSWPGADSPPDIPQRRRD